jgi:hypothetical protein
MPKRRWTDHQLREAIATSTTWVEVHRRLGLSASGGSNPTVRRRCDELGLDHGHIGAPAARRRWTDTQLTEAVATSTNLRQVFVALGLRVGGGAWLAMQDHIRRLELSTAHWDRPVPPERPARPTFSWSPDEVRAACSDARSVRQVMERLGLDPNRKLGRAAVERHLRDLGVDPAELDGQGWARGRTQPRRNGRPLEDILVLGPPALNTHDLKLRLVRAGLLTWRCATCGLTSWRGAPLSLHLDHVNGDRCDNRLENLRLLCPNCHSQTDTFAGRNIGER